MTRTPILVLLLVGAACNRSEAIGEAQAAVPVAVGDATIMVEVEGVRSGEGQMLGLLFNQERGYPTKPDKAMKQVVVPAAKGTVSVSFEGIAPGTYAASVVHDENGNGKLDTNVLGIPKEGVGASNRAKSKLGPPKWKDAKFTVDGDTATAASLWYP